jgi:hypothetical protein
MDDKTKSSKSRLRSIIFKAAKATIKAVIVYVAYFFIWSLLSPLSELIPVLQQMLETFVIIYIVLMILGDLTSGTIYQHFFSAAKTLFVVGYLILSLNGGIFGVTFENISLMIDLRIFVIIAMILSLLGLAKSVIQAIDYMNNKAEFPTI